MSLSLYAILKESDRARQATAVRGLADGSITITVIHRSDSEIRAAVQNGAGVTYSVKLTEHDVFCSCPDALYRGAVCKHIQATAHFCLQQQETDGKIHLMWGSGEILCGHTLTPYTRFWRNWTGNALNWSDIICQTCVHTWTHPQQTNAAA
jgi:hypothetical protein